MGTRYPSQGVGVRRWQLAPKRRPEYRTHRLTVHITPTLRCVRQLTRQVNRVLLSASLAGPHVPNAIVQQMLRPLRCNDIRPALRTLVDNCSGRGRFLNFCFFEITRPAWQCCDGRHTKSGSPAIWLSSLSGPLDDPPRRRSIMAEDKKMPDEYLGKLA